MFFKLVLAGTTFEEIHSVNQCGNSDQQIYNPFNSWPCAEEQVYQVEVGVQEVAETDKTPVEGADQYKNSRDQKQRVFTFFHSEKG